ncbi:MAG TPA: hypothetical protein VFI70_12465 [Nitrososphaeraceae archaeon]|nr:hypothetical protein [Nitrososphaeraceae archaeon]
MDNAKAELGLIGQIVTSLSYTIKHQNISSATPPLPISFSSTTGAAATNMTSTNATSATKTR